MSYATAHIHQFIDMLSTERQLSIHTTKNYERQLNAVVNLLTLDDWTQLTHDKIKQLLMLCHRQGLSVRSINLRLTVLRTFCDYLIEKHIITLNPAADIKALKQSKPLPKQLNVDEMNALLSFDEDSFIGLRDKAIFELLYGCGLRLSELTQLNIQDQQGNQLRVMGKGSKERILPIGKIALGALKAWLKVRQAYTSLEDADAMFVSKHKKRISNRQVQKRLTRWAQEQTLYQKISPHTLRHSYATHILESSGDLRGVQELLGHADLSTTQVYTHLNFQHLSKVYDNAHPRARKK